MRGWNELQKNNQISSPNTSKKTFNIIFFDHFFVHVVLIEAPNIKLLKKVMQVPESAQKLREIKIL